jgi:hypothetical protein
MQRALSAENLAEIAHGAIKGLRRLVSPGSASGASASSDTPPSLSDFVSTMKVVEECSKRGQKLDPTVMELNVSSLSLELEAILGQEDGAPHSPLGSSQAAAFPPRPGAAKQRQTLTDLQLVQAVDCIKALYRKLPSGAVTSCLVEHRILERFVMLLHAPKGLSRRATDAIFGATVNHLSESLDCFLATADAFARLLCAADAENLSPPSLRVMLLLFYALRRADLVNVSHANEVKCRLHQGGVLTQMCSTAVAMAARHKASPGDDSASLLVTCGVLSLATAGAISRSNMPHKLEVRSNRAVLDAWVYLSCNVSKVDPALTASSYATGEKTKMEDVVWPAETSTVWAAEIAEFIVEICTTNSFSLRRQAQCCDRSTTPSTPPNQMGRPPTAPSTVSERCVRKWEPLPPDWDTMISGGAVSVWELTAQVSHCVLSLESATAVVELLPLIDASSQQTEYIYRAIISSLVLLCQATPQNVVMLQEAGAFSTLISLLTDPSASTFPLDSKLKPAFLMRLGDSSWHVTMGLLTVLTATHFGKNDLQLLVSAVDAMRLCETTAEDCEIIEQLLLVAGRSRFAKDTLWFAGSESAVSCSVEKFAGRWYGYSFAAWLNPSCVWSEGCSVFSVFESGTSLSVTVTIVANGRHKSLAVRTLSAKELTIAVLPDTTIPDGWCHVAFVNNISGFTVYINGRKCACSPNVPFPKEPSKQNKLILSFGGEAALPSLLSSPQPKSPIPSFFGTICGPAVLDGALSEKEVERMASGLPGHPLEGPPLSIPEMLGVHVAPGQPHGDSPAVVEVTGSSAKKENCVVQNVVAYLAADTAQAFTDLGVVDWVMSSLEKAADSPNRNIIAVLLLEFLNVHVKICKDGVALLAERNVIARVRTVLLQWENLPSQIHISLLSVTVSKGTGKKMRPHQSTSHILSLVMELINAPNCTPGTKSGVLKELSDFLTVAENVKLFREGAKFESVLALGRRIPVECVDDLVMLVEKLCKEPPEMELLIKFLLFEPKSAVVAKCEILRMLYDVSKSNQAVCETIGNVLGGNGIVALLFLVQGTAHQSEVLRIYAVRLLALILHCSRRHREQFTRLSGYELLIAALVKSRHPAGPPVRLATFNCLFKFALGFFQPASALDSVHSSVMSKIASAPPPLKRTSPGSSSTQHSDPHFAVGASLGFHGHLPSLVPSNGSGARRVYSVDLSSAECGDVESRLSVDDNYNSQSSQSDTLVHPQLICVVLALLGRVLAQSSPAADAPKPEAAEGQEAAGEVQSSASVSTRREEDAPEPLAMKVLQYLDRMVDLVPNAIELLPHPWLEWLWGCVEPVLTQPSADSTATAPGPAASIEGVVRSFIRKMAVVDLSRGPKQSYLRRAKELCDAPLLQRIVLEEVVRHFSMNNRLDTMEAGDAQNVIRNVDVLFQGLDEVLVPFPAALGIEIAHAVGAIALNNNAWVRQKMKQQSKLFETRDRLAFATLLTTVKDFSKQDPTFLDALVDANLQDPNTAIVLLRALVESVRDRQIDEVEAIQTMIRRIFAVDDEQRKTITRVLGESPEVQDLIVSQRRVLQGSEVPMTDMISWCMANDGRWEQVVQKILRAAKPIEAETSVRLEKREKERSTRAKTRRGELEKKQTAHAKILSDYEKWRIDVVENRAAGYKESEGHDE